MDICMDMGTDVRMGTCMDAELQATDETDVLIVIQMPTRMSVQMVYTEPYKEGLNTCLCRCPYSSLYRFV